ncbi:MAG: hypothetical protein B7Z10_07805 [Rhodobacterales bacterium 32-66-7]|nr:MAG: hypothetical protein B7Z31_15910 [Rhodobacterales bacterium 12-65-15]OYX24951.1 MAG: hypothetical protein B7Z10_07805 [Rhodobacterales bacterium 32-66-7]
MSSVAIQQMADRVAGLMEERLKLGGGSLAAKLKRGQRALPKRVRDAALLLAEAAEKVQHPKLVAQVDMGAVSDAYDLCVRHLMTVDPGSRRRDYLASMVSTFGFGVLTLILVLIAFLAWRGYL